jgi:uncharacterized membrane protein YeaQ/YmgE (transglycosylase-associated protein family)
MSRKSDPARSRAIEKKGTTTMLSFLIWVLMGGLIGLVSSNVMRRDPERGALVYILIGATGGLIGGVVFDGEITPSIMTFGSMLAAFVSAVLVVSMAKLFVRPAER